MKDTVYYKLCMLANDMQTKIRNNGVDVVDGQIPIGAIRTSTLEAYLEELDNIITQMESEFIKEEIDNS